MSQSEAGYQSPSGTSQSNSEAQQLLASFWQRTTDDIKLLGTNDFKQQELPLARIKKIMKLDEDVKMISAEAPVLFAKAAEIFVTELSLRAWTHTEDNKRRTLQRNDIAMAISKFDVFDFLIDIVPRDELKTTKRQDEGVRATAMLPDHQVQYYFQLAQHHQAALQQQSPQPQGSAQIQIIQQGGQVQTVGTTTQAGIPVQTIATPTTVQVQTQSGDAQQSLQLAQSAPAQMQVQANAAQPQLIQIQQPATVQSPVAQPGHPQGPIQLIQQIVANTGEIQQIPIQLSPAQLQVIRMQMQGQSANQPIIIQATPTQQVQQQGTQAVYQIQPVAAQAAQGQGPTPVFLTSAQGQQTIQIQQITAADQGNGTEEQSQ